MNQSPVGDHEIGLGDPTTPDAGVSDGTVDGGGAIVSDVNGTAIDHRATAPFTTAAVPEDLSGFVLQAYIRDDSPGGFRIIDAGRSNSSFTIHDVPEGGYDLLIVAPGDPVPHFYHTSSHTLDIGVNALGRVDGPPATQSTLVSFDLTGASPPTGFDTVFIDSFSTGAESLAGLGSGQTELIAAVDWRDTGAPLLSAAEGDDLFVNHVRRATSLNAAGQTTRSIVDSFSTHSLTLVDGQPATVNGSFTVPPSTFLNAQMFPAGYFQGDVPVHEPMTILLRLRAGLTGALSQGAPLLDVNQAVLTSQQTVFSGGSYNDPYPPSWQRFVVSNSGIFFNYAARGTTQVATYFANTSSRAPLSSFVSIEAQFPAVRGITLGGVDSSQAGAVPFDGVHPVTIAWQPVIGVEHYSVTAMQLTSDGTAATLNFIATFDTGELSAAMPASLFQVGGSYVFSVQTVVDPTTDFAGGALRRLGFPIAIHDAVTARLLFASSCGNGVVDAPFEQCDSGGIATENCNADCTLPRCGDGIANTLAQESCDDAGDSAFCNANCTRAACGDGVVHFAGGEQCDDGNTVSGDGCSSDCQVEPLAVCSGEPSICHF